MKKVKPFSELMNDAKAKIRGQKIALLDLKRYVDSETNHLRKQICLWTFVGVSVVTASTHYNAIRGHFFVSPLMFLVGLTVGFLTGVRVCINAMRRIIDATQFEILTQELYTEKYQHDVEHY